MIMTKTLFISLGLIVSANAFAAAKKIKVKKTTPSSQVQSNDNTNNSGPGDATNLSDQQRQDKSLAMNNSNSSGTMEREYRYITDGGNPAPGAILISPMIGEYALAGLEVGTKISVRVADHAFVPAINNSVSVEGEVFRGTWWSPFGKNESLFTAVTGRWDFHLTPKWTVYGAAGVSVERKLTIADYEVSETDVEPTMQYGGMLILSRNLRLRAEFNEANASFRFGCVYAM